MESKFKNERLLFILLFILHIFTLPSFAQSNLVNLVYFVSF